MLEECVQFADSCATLPCEDPGPVGPLQRRGDVHRVGIVGTGFIARGLHRVLSEQDDLCLGPVLSRREDGNLPGLTLSIDGLLKGSDVVVECSGDVHHAAHVVRRAHEAGLPVVTMNAEFQVTVGSAYVDTGVLTEAAGDQPGCLAALHEEAVAMGFEPVVYGNYKGFLNHLPTPEEMDFWAAKLGQRVVRVTSFTDGTKLQIEQALLGNGLGAGIARRGLTGSASVEALVEDLGTFDNPVVDYVLGADHPPGVFLLARHPTADPDTLRYLKLGEGPLYLLQRPYHLCHLEVPGTIRRVMAGGRPLLDNGRQPTLNVAAVAKRSLAAGTRIERGIGGFDVRGEVVRHVDHLEAVPVGLLDGAVLTRDRAAGDILGWEDVEIRPGDALTAALAVWRC